MRLNYDPAPLLDELNSMPVEEVPGTRVLRASGPKHLIIKLLASAYVEFAMYMRALLAKRGEREPLFYLDPMPRPLKADPSLVGFPAPPNVYYLNLATAEVVDTIPAEPFLAVRLNLAQHSMTDFSQPATAGSDPTPIN